MSEIINMNDMPTEEELMAEQALEKELAEEESKFNADELQVKEASPKRESDTTPKWKREGLKRITATIPESYYHDLYWHANREGVSVNTILADAVQYYLEFKNGITTENEIFIDKMNQIIDRCLSLESTVGNMERNVISSLDSLVSLTRGDNYLLEGDNGEIGV